jgi:coproporphyrinogen III oxidase-like Fe-S oxidoreductase
MASEVTDLLVALKAWHKAVKQLNNQDQSLQARQQTLKQASQSVLHHLAADTVEAEIDALIQRAAQSSHSSAQDVRDRLQQDADTLITVELRSLRPLSVSRTQFHQGAIGDRQALHDPQGLNDTEQLQTVFLTLSSALSAEYQETAALSRKPKKRRRRDVTLCALQTLLGVGLLAGNTQFDSGFANASYILGGNALLSALQNVVGQLDEAASDRL